MIDSKRWYLHNFYHKFRFVDNVYFKSCINFVNKKYVIFIHGHMDTSILRKQLEMFVY
jgi:hypothetical protein